MENGIIYRAYDSEGKSYIGQTTKGLEHRRKQHEKSNDNKKFHIALKEKGLDEFKWEVLEDNIQEAKLLERERYWAKVFDACKNGYNGKNIQCFPRNAAANMKGKHHSEETKIKISNALKGHLISNETKNKISNTLQGNTCALGHSLSEEKRKEIGEKVSKALKGKPKSKEHAKKVADANRGRKISEETRAKLREAWKRRKGEI